MDALLFLAVDRRCLLIPWDIHMAKQRADAEAVVPYGEFERQPIKAARAAADFFKIPAGSKLEIPAVTAYPAFLRFVEGLSDFDVLCREGGAADEIVRLRAIKDAAEIAVYRTAAAATNATIAALEAELAAGKLPTEADVALFVEAEARRRGGEGVGFETIAAGPGRSFGIHAFPSYTAAPFGGDGLSILDFGLKFDGYTTDVTVTVARGALTRKQLQQLSLVEKAYTLAVGVAAPGVGTREIALAVESLFGKSKRTMPHALGHGIGLEAHEAPAVRSRADNDWKLEPGMVFTIEPGLYDPSHGGCRLENDLLVTPTGVEILTKARIIRL
jgi:Xaa-Pro dipeptidase